MRSVSNPNITLLLVFAKKVNILIFLIFDRHEQNFSKLINLYSGLSYNLKISTGYSVFAKMIQQQQQQNEYFLNKKKQHTNTNITCVYKYLMLSV